MVKRERASCSPDERVRKVARVTAVAVADGTDPTATTRSCDAKPGVDGSDELWPSSMSATGVQDSDGLTPHPALADDAPASCLGPEAGSGQGTDGNADVGNSVNGNDNNDDDDGNNDDDLDPMLPDAATGAASASDPDVGSEAGSDGSAGSDDSSSSGSSSGSDSSSSEGGGLYTTVSPDKQLELLREHGVPPIAVLRQLGIPETASRHYLDVRRDEAGGSSEDDMLWNLALRLITTQSVRWRRKLPQHNTLQDAVDLIRSSNNILVLTGAGVSVSCGIPDFRSADGGIYARLEREYNLPEPEAMFDIEYFRDDPRPFFSFAREIYPGKYQPSAVHYFIRLLEQRGKLLRNYSQNIDTLENVAGITRVLQCHGSFATASCMLCRRQVPCDTIKPEIMRQEIPHCGICSGPDAVMKPDITFFGEKLSDAFEKALVEDQDRVDLLIVIGSSLKVSPVAEIPRFIPADVPAILINREVVGQPSSFDIELLGNADVVVAELCHHLGQDWTLPPTANGLPSHGTEIPVYQTAENRFEFPGAQPPPPQVPQPSSMLALLEDDDAGTGVHAGHAGDGDGGVGSDGEVELITNVGMGYPENADPALDPLPRGDYGDVLPVSDDEGAVEEPIGVMNSPAVADSDSDIDQDVGGDSGSGIDEDAYLRGNRDPAAAAQQVSRRHDTVSEDSEGVASSP